MSHEASIVAEGKFAFKEKQVYDIQHTCCRSPLFKLATKEFDSSSGLKNLMHSDKGMAHAKSGYSKFSSFHCQHSQIALFLLIHDEMKNRMIRCHSFYMKKVRIGRGHTASI